MNRCPVCKTIRGRIFEGVGCTDDPNQGIAFNLYICNNCMIVVRDDVWEGKGVYILREGGKVEKVTE